jgi:hypothetical protein
MNCVCHHIVLELEGQRDEKGRVCSTYRMAFGRET